MEKKRDGGPAFPPSVIKVRDNSEGIRRVGIMAGPGGMSRRDWFAGQALAGIIAAHAHTNAHGLPNDKDASRYAYEYADAMIKEGE